MAFAVLQSTGPPSPCASRPATCSQPRGDLPAAVSVHGPREGATRGMGDGVGVMRDLLVEAEMKKALDEPGCALCRVGEEAARRYLRFVLHEDVYDLGVRRRLIAAWGFCRRHAWHFLRLESATMRDGLGNAVLAEGLLEAVQQVITAEAIDAPSQLGFLRRDGAHRLRALRDVLRPTTECPACAQQRQHEAYVASMLVGLLAEPEWRARVARSDGLCLPHLRMALDEAHAEGSPEWLLADHRRRLDALLGDLREYIRKHDYRFRSEPPGPERDAHVRATASLAGTWFELPAPRDETQQVDDRGEPVPRSRDLGR